MQLSISCSRRPTSSVAIVSLFLAITALCAWGQDLEGERARAEDFPLAVTLPEGWETKPASQDEPGEVLFLQSMQGPEAGGFMTFSVYPVSGPFKDLVRRQTYHVVVNLGVPLTVNQSFKLRGVRGHKWIYRAPTAEGDTRQFYRLYLIIPGHLTGKRLLVVHGDAPLEQAQDSLFTFNAVARSMGWGLQAEGLSTQKP